MRIIIILSVLLFLIGCKEKDGTVKESNKNPLNDVAYKETFKDTADNVQSSNLNRKNEDATSWKGKYYFEANNKDDAKTSFEITIKQLDDISVRYISDDNVPEVYNKIAGELITPEKLKINYNPADDEMGVLFLEKEGNEFTIFGKPIYFINPGNDNLPIKKTE